MSVYWIGYLLVFGVRVWGRDLRKDKVCGLFIVFGRACFCVKPGRFYCLVGRIRMMMITTKKTGTGNCGPGMISICVIQLIWTDCMRNEHEIMRFVFVASLMKSKHGSSAGKLVNIWNLMVCSLFSLLDYIWLIYFNRINWQWINQTFVVLQTFAFSTSLNMFG